MTCSASGPESAAERLHEQLIELQRRRAARVGLIDFARYTLPSYRAEPVHELIASRLDDVVEGRLKRLMIFAPPQVGKSQLTSVHLPAYWLGRQPNGPVILTSYAASLAYSKSRQARAIVESSEYATVFPGTKTNSASRAVDHWELEGSRGALLAAGVGGPIMGHGAALGIIDDPVENWEQAQSDNYRTKTWEWWQSTFRTRIWEGGAVVLIQTRWHQEDLAGRLLREQPGRWDVLRLPAIAETQEERDENDLSLGLPTGQPDPIGRAPGEPLSPGRFSSEELEQVRHDVGSIVWNSLYQGVPRPAEGALFKTSWFKVVERPPAGLRWVRYWDLAASTKTSADCTASARCALSEDGMLFITEVIRGRWEWPDARRIITQTARAESGVVVGVERTGFQLAAVQDLRRDPAMAGVALREVGVDRDKMSRALPWAARAEAGKVALVSGSWVQEFVAECVAFPQGAHDDQVDAVSGCMQLLDRPRKRRAAISGSIFGVIRRR